MGSECRCCQDGCGRNSWRSRCDHGPGNGSRESGEWQCCSCGYIHSRGYSDDVGLGWISVKGKEESRWKVSYLCTGLLILTLTRMYGTEKQKTVENNTTTRHNTVYRWCVHTWKTNKMKKNII